MAGAARGCAAGSGQVGDANVVSGHIKWSETVDPSAVQGIPGVVSENSRPFFVVPQPPPEAGGFYPRAKQMFYLSLPPVARSVKRRCNWVSPLQRCGGIWPGQGTFGARSTCQAVALAVSMGLVVVLQRVATDFEVCGE